MIYRRNRRASLAVMLVCFPVLLCVLPAAAAKAGITAEQDPITHSVSVDLMLVPVFAVGADGNPVFDLQKDDFELYANGSPVTITQFVRFDFNTGTRRPNANATAVKPTRAVFIIIDSVFNSFFGFQRSKKIARKIIENSSPDDIFIILENRAGGGLRHLAGPDVDRRTILRQINSIKLPSAKRDASPYLTREWNPDADRADPAFSNATMENISNKARHLEKQAYQNQVLHFSRFLEKLKYALKTITRPKMVYLISEGISNAAFRDLQEPETVKKYGKNYSALLKDEKRVNESKEFYEHRLFVAMQEVVKAMNAGGSVLYTINPGKTNRDEDAAGSMSMKFMAYESGGRYIAGKDTDKIIEKVKKTTSAYYELAFNPPPGIGDNVMIQLKCKRKGIQLNTFKSTERSKPYHRMDAVEKKLFALNMVTGGSWSRLLGKVIRIKFKKLRDENFGGQKTTMIEIQLPEQMKHRQLDLFAIQVNPKANRVNIEMTSRKVKDRANLIIKKKDDTEEFFVLIEPDYTYCIYNKV